MSMIQELTLAGTDWTISGTKGGFTPFTARFHEDGKVECETINKIFSAVLNWAESGNSFHISGNWDTPGGELDWNLIGTDANANGSGHYTIDSSAGKQIGSFTMSENS